MTSNDKSPLPMSPVAALTQEHFDSQPTSTDAPIKMPPVADGTWTPTLFFFYGSLMDTDVLRTVLNLPQTPAPLRRAKVRNFKMKMWGVYPGLVPTNTEGEEEEENVVEGRVYLVEKLSHFFMLQRYESNAYTWCNLEVEFEDGTKTSECRVFIFADPDSNELEDGRFDLEHFQKYFKPTMDYD